MGVKIHSSSPFKGMGLYKYIPLINLKKTMPLVMGAIQFLI
jgi:hypothetical protein